MKPEFSKKILNKERESIKWQNFIAKILPNQSGFINKAEAISNNSLRLAFEFYIKSLNGKHSETPEGFRKSDWMNLPDSHQRAIFFDAFSSVLIDNGTIFSKVCSFSPSFPFSLLFSFPIVFFSSILSS